MKNHEEWLKDYYERQRKELDKKYDFREKTYEYQGESVTIKFYTIKKVKA